MPYSVMPETGSNCWSARVAALPEEKTQVRLASKRSVNL